MFRSSEKTSPAPQTWTCRFAGRDYELDVTPGISTRLVLRVDGEQRYDQKGMDDRRTIKLGGDRRVLVVLGKTGNIRRATVSEGGRDMDFDAPAGSRAARTQQWGREHPTLYALRLVGIQLGVWAIAILGLGALFKALIEPLVRWLAERMPDIDIPWPDIDLPYIPWSEIHLPRIPFPDIEPPWWLIAFFDWVEPYEDFVKALVIGVVLAIAEVRRQRRQKRLRASAASGSGGSAEQTPTAIPTQATTDGSDSADSPMEGSPSVATTAQAQVDPQDRRVVRSVDGLGLQGVPDPAKDGPGEGPTPVDIPSSVGP